MRLLNVDLGAGEKLWWFGSQASHGGSQRLYLQFQGIQRPLLAFAGTRQHTYRQNAHTRKLKINRSLKVDYLLEGFEIYSKIEKKNHGDFPVLL